MAGKRRIQRERRKRRTGCVTALVMLIILGGGAAYGIPWAADRFGAQVRETFGGSVEKTVHTLQTAGVDFPEVSVTAEEVSGHFYYQQLTEEEQTVYRELLQGVSSMEETILVHAGRDDHPEKVYEYLLYDCPELFWCVWKESMHRQENMTRYGISMNISSIPSIMMKTRRTIRTSTAPL